MRHRTHQLPVLQDRAAAHALYDAAGLRQQRLVRHRDEQIPAVFCVRVDAVDADGKALDLFAVHIGQDLRRAGRDRRSRRRLDSLSGLRL